MSADFGAGDCDDPRRSLVRWSTFDHSNQVAFFDETAIRQQTRIGDTLFVDVNVDVLAVELTEHSIKQRLDNIWIIRDYRPDIRLSRSASRQRITTQRASRGFDQNGRNSRIVYEFLDQL